MSSNAGLLARIAGAEGDNTEAGRTGQTANAENEAGASGAAPPPPPPPDLAELEEFLTDALMGGIEWAYDSRAAVAGPHWSLTEPETATIRKPAARVVAKWAPRLAAFVPSFAAKFKEELVLFIVLVTVTKGRLVIDRRLAAEAAAAQPEGGPTDGEGK